MTSIAVFIAIITLASTDALAFDVETVLNSGPPSERFDVLILGDGYTAEQQDLLSSDVQWAVDVIFERMPFIRYKPLFNFHVVHVVSNEDGIDNGALGEQRDTALGGRFQCEGAGFSGMCVDNDLVAQIATEAFPGFNHIMVVANDIREGAWAGNGYPYGITRYSRASTPALAHEMGHRWAGLGDEYDTPFTNPLGPCDPALDCPEPNLTVRPNEPRWAHWIVDLDNVPTSGSLPLGQAGMFAGGRYGEPGVYRPAPNCKMRDPSAAFCVVCREHINLSLWHLDDVSMIADATPSPGEMAGIPGEFAFSIVPATVSPVFWEFWWSVDDEEFARGEASLSVTLGAGFHEVVGRLHDATPDVRHDPTRRMWDEVRWVVSVSDITRDAGVGVDSGAPFDPRDGGSQMRQDSGPADAGEDEPALSDSGSDRTGDAGSTVVDSGGPSRAPSDASRETDAWIAHDAGQSTIIDSAPADLESAEAGAELSARGQAPTAGASDGCSCHAVGETTDFGWLPVLGGLLALGALRRSRAERPMIRSAGDRWDVITIRRARSRESLAERTT